MDQAISQNKDGPRLSSLTRGRPYDPQGGEAYSRFVRSMRYILPLAALGLVAVALTWHENDERLAPALPPAELRTGEAVQHELLSPSFTGVDAEGRPFEIRAGRATQDTLRPGLVQLDAPGASLRPADAPQMDLSAQRGVYEQDSEKLFLEGDVTLERDGYRLETGELRVNLKTQDAFSGKDVRVTGPAGDIAASGLEARQGAGTLIFKGPATLTLKRQDAEESGGAP